MVVPLLFSLYDAFGPFMILFQKSVSHLSEYGGAFLLRDLILDYFKLLDHLFCYNVYFISFIRKNRSLNSQ